MDSSRDVLGIADWAVSNATLEEVFFAVVRLARLADLRKPNGLSPFACDEGSS